MRKRGPFRPGSVASVALVALFATTPCLAQDACESYSKAIKIKGNESYRKSVRATLDALSKLPTGKKLLADIEAAAKDGKVVTIEFGEGRADYTPVTPSAVTPEKASIGADGRVEIEKPGKGSPGDVHFDPNYASFWRDKTTDWAKKVGEKRLETVCDCLTPEILLGHELIHALHGLQGRNLTDFPITEADGNKTNHEEVWTSGVGLYANEPLSENGIRRDQNRPARESYEWLCPNAPSMKELQEKIKAYVAKKDEEATKKLETLVPKAHEVGLIEALDEALTSEPKKEPSAAAPKGTATPSAPQGKKKPTIDLPLGGD